MEYQPKLNEKYTPLLLCSSRSQKIKNITKIEHTLLFLFTFLVSFFYDVDDDDDDDDDNDNDNHSKTEFHNK